MKLSISNIGWSEEDDWKIYENMRKMGYLGLEIAPTRIFPSKPYEDTDAAKAWSEDLYREYGFVVSSIQSIWYGRTEMIYGSDEERLILSDYTKKAVDFAETVGCGNLVFGCPKNRSIIDGKDQDVAVTFFREISEYAAMHNCAIALEANPPIYNTNFLNTTEETLGFIKRVGSAGLLLNLDTGSMLENGEDVSVLKGNERYIHHVHISEPRLMAIKRRGLHEELAVFLKDMAYDRFVSIEVGRQENSDDIVPMMEYVKGIFG